MMTPDFKEMTRREIEDYLVERAMIEPEFRHRLLTEPVPLLRELGLPVGDDVQIRVFEEEPKTFFLVLPRVLREAEDLSDTEVDDVSGGLGSPTEMFRFFGGYS
jgi:hypothetical protein